MYKKYIIVVVVVAVLWGGFMLYRQNKKKQDVDTYTQKANSQVTRAAKASPRAGLSRMARALNKYYKDNNTYPSNLIELYPRYMANKSFIEDVDWYYEPRGNDFHLSKAMTFGEKTMVASVDKSLRPETETTTMVASPTPVPKAKKVIKPKEFEIHEAEPAKREETDEERLEIARHEFLMALRKRQMYVTSVSVPETEEARIVSSVQPEIMSITEDEIVKGLASELGQRYLVWKDKGGVLGFSNVQYPDTDRLSIHAVGRWFNVRAPSSKAEGPIEEETVTARERKDRQSIAETFQNRYLVWKDKSGTLGFGNNRYPETDRTTVLQANRWVSLKKPYVATETQFVEKEKDQEKPTSPKTVAERFGTQHLVWKDKNGTVGFGNTQYPETDRTTVLLANRWVSLKKPYVATATQVVEKKKDQKKTTSPETVAEKFGTQHLVWKDKNGTVGFGNLQYPKRDLSRVFYENQWVSLKKPYVATETQFVEKEKDQEKPTSPETVAEKFGTQHLVWKDKNGTVGFGNLQYPKRDLSRVFHENQWVSLKRPYVAPETQVVEKKKDQKKTTSPETVAEKFGAQHLVWKDKSGTVGFGNVQYPEMDNISHIHANGSWQPVNK